MSITWMCGASLDGFMEGPGHDISWHLVDEEVHAHINDVLRTAGAYVEGRISHELMCEAWPTMDQDPDCSPTMAEYAGIWRSTPKYVLSRTIESDEWATVLPSIDPDQIRAIDASVDGDVVIGGSNTAAQFIELDLLDQFRMYLNPVLLGKGTPMFQADGHRNFSLLDSRTFGNGVVYLHYGR